MRAAILALLASAGCHFNPEGAAHGDIPFVIVNNTPVKIGSVAFRVVGHDYTWNDEGTTSDIEAGARRTFHVKAAPYSILINGWTEEVAGRVYEMATYDVTVDPQHLIELVVTAEPYAPAVTDGFSRVTVAPKPHPVQHDGHPMDPADYDCNLHVCPADTRCAIGAGGNGKVGCLPI